MVLCDTIPWKGMDPLKAGLPNFITCASTARRKKSLRGFPQDDAGRGLTMEILSRVHAKKLVEWATDKPEVVVLSADLTGSTEADLFQNAYPQRFFSTGHRRAKHAELRGRDGQGRLRAPRSTPSRFSFTAGPTTRSPCRWPIPTCRSRCSGSFPAFSRPAGPPTRPSRISRSCGPCPT